jgi:hypothetical protein
MIHAYFTYLPVCGSYASENASRRYREFSVKMLPMFHVSQQTYAQNLMEWLCELALEGLIR